jgi:lipopolysaccharide/colanic/teichoic acid biosynthesis glycosyltransferase
MVGSNVRTVRAHVDRTKRAVDVIGAGLALVVLSPILGVAACAVLVTMGSPILYRDTRAGRDGDPFELLKFRTMRALMPGETIPESDGARITRIGRILRATSVDELPSLVNVLRGDLSLVGPRPLPVRYVPRYSPTQARRLEVRPGITGWAQVNGRNDISWDDRFALDVWYVDHRSLGLDLRIVVSTVGKLVRREGISHEDHASMPEFTGTSAPS